MSSFKKLAKNYEGEAKKMLTEFVGKQSYYDASSVGEGAPFGKGVKSALDYLAQKGKEYGFKVDTCQGYATELTAGEGDGPEIGIYAHADVVPASGKWNYPPFAGKIVGEGKEAKMYGRGTSDDKGPLVAALMAVRLLKDNGYLKNFKVRFVAGGNEENGSACLKAYFGKLGKKPTDYGFTPDADFPLIYAEKGMIGATIKRSIDLSPIIAMNGGSVSNAVCASLLVTLPMDQKLLDFLKEKKASVDVNPIGNLLILTFKGKTAHGSMPEKGVNAALEAFQLLGEFYKIPFLSKLGKTLSDTTGASFGGADVSEIFGPATYCVGLVNYENRTHVLTLSLDYRHGEKTDTKKAIEGLKKAIEADVEVNSDVPYLLYDPKSPLVSTLMKSYKRTTWKLFDKPMAIGGGTYAKEAPNCVAYGSAFAGHPGDIHSPNEYIYLDDLYKQIYIYADAIYSLGKLKK